MNKWDLIRLKGFCTAKETISEKTTYGTGENISKWCDQEGVNFQNKQLTQLKKKNNPKKQTKKSKNEQKIEIDTSPKKT